MILHPVVLGIKLLFLIVIIVTLLVLNSVLTPEQFRIALWIAPAVFILGVVALWVFAVRVLRNPNSKLGKQMILYQQARADDGYVASTDRFSSMVGTRGVAISPLRPVGTALFGQERISVVTEGEFMEVGSQVEIVSAKGSRVVVRPTRVAQS